MGTICTIRFQDFYTVIYIYINIKSFFIFLVILNLCSGHLEQTMKFYLIMHGK